MGNEVSVASPQTTGDLLRDLNVDFPDFVPQSVLGNFKLFKVVHCAHDSYRSSGAVVKIFFSGIDEAGELSSRVQKVLSLRSQFSSLLHANVVPYDSADVSPRSAILVRQFFGKNLHERLFSPPLLTHGQKMWLSFQLLAAAAQLHSAGICHGDLKLENVFVSSSLHLMVSDIALFKPVAFLAEDPVASFSLFYEGDLKKRKCFVAPERFVAAGSRRWFDSEPFTELLSKIDSFSIGCCLAELFLDGAHVCDLPEVLLFRTGGFDPAENIHAKVQDPKARALISALLRRQPAERPSALDALQSENIFPPAFMNILLPLFFICAQPPYTQADCRMIFLRENLNGILRAICPAVKINFEFDRFTTGEVFDTWEATPGSARLRLDGALKHPVITSTSGERFSRKLFDLWRLGARAASANDVDQWRELLPMKLSELYDTLSGEDVKSQEVNVDEYSLDVFLTLLGSTAALSTFPRSKLIFLQVAAAVAPSASQAALCDILIPYVHDFAVSADSQPIRAAALTALVAAVRALEKSETGLFSDYLFPAVLSVEPAAALPAAAALATEAMRLAAGSVDYDKKLAAIEMFMERAVQRVGALKNSTTAKMAFLSALPLLSVSGVSFKTLLPAVSSLITDQHWAVRAAACRYPTAVSFPTATVETVILPIQLQGLQDADERVLSSALISLESLICAVELRLKLLLSVAEKVHPFLFHPNRVAISSKAERLLSVVLAARIPQADQLVFLQSILASSRCLDELPAEQPLSYDMMEAIAFRSQGQVPFGARKAAEALKQYISSFAKAAASRIKEEVSSAAEVNRYSLEVIAVNPGIPGVRDYTVVAEWEDFMKPSAAPVLSEINWRVAALCLPRSPMEIGTLSSLDGSFTSLYTAQAVSQQRDYLSTLPGVPMVKISPPKMPEGVALATLAEFQGGAVAIDATDDGRIVVAAGAAGSVGIYRLAHLDKEGTLTASKRLELNTKLRKLKVLRNSKAVAIPSDGNLSIYRLDSSSLAPIAKCSAKFGEILDLVQFDAAFESCIFGVTRNGRLFGWDYRSDRIACNVPLPCLSLASSLCVLRDCLTAVVGHYSGKLSLIDLRSSRALKSYRLSGRGSSVLTLAPSATPGCVWLASGSDVCEVSVETGGVPRHYFLVSEAAASENHAPITIPHLLPIEEAAGILQADFDEIPRDALGGEYSCRKIIPLSSGSVFTAHADEVVRIWQPSTETAATVPRSAVVSSLSTVGSVKVFAQQPPKQKGGGHRDAITDCCLASLQSEMLITAGRDGLVKIWK